MIFKKKIFVAGDSFRNNTFDLFMSFGTIFGMMLRYFGMKIK